MVFYGQGAHCPCAKDQVSSASGHNALCLKVKAILDAIPIHDILGYLNEEVCGMVQYPQSSYVHYMCIVLFDYNHC